MNYQFPHPELETVRSRLYRSRVVPFKHCWKRLPAIYNIQSVLNISDLEISVNILKTAANKFRTFVPKTQLSMIIRTNDACVMVKKAFCQRTSVFHGALRTRLVEFETFCNKAIHGRSNASPHKKKMSADRVFCRAGSPLAAVQPRPKRWVADSGVVRL